MTSKISILQAGIFPQITKELLQESFEVLSLSSEDILPESAADIRGIIVRNHPLSARLLAKLPKLEIISSYNAGLDGVDLDYCRAHKIVVFNTSTVLANEVADLALGFAIALTRNLVSGHEFVCKGEWAHQEFKFGRSLSTMKTGIVGLGHIGQALARRMDMVSSEVAYYGPNPKDVPYQYFDDLKSLASWTDLLFICCPATAQTKGMINHEILDALGAQGLLINIARGSIVDENALITSLQNKTIEGAGLDVFCHEPHVPEALRLLPNVILSPHTASATHDTRRKMGEHAISRLREHFIVAAY